jgi:hypothetical protein
MLETKDILTLVGLALTAGALFVTVDFTNFCPIRQQLMSNFMRAVRFSPLP